VVRRVGCSGYRETDGRADCYNNAAVTLIGENISICTWICALAATHFAKYNTGGRVKRQGRQNGVRSELIYCNSQLAASTIPSCHVHYEKETNPKGPIMGFCSHPYCETPEAIVPLMHCARDDPESEKLEWCDKSVQSHPSIRARTQHSNTGAIATC
jgi:hypothetical protein